MRHAGRSLLSTDDLDDREVCRLLDRARELNQAQPAGLDPFSAGLLFQSSSTRTRVGFASAAVRLGGVPIDIAELRGGSEMSAYESLADTLRTISGMVDVIVARTTEPLDRQMVFSCCGRPLVNAGDARNEHPSQALLDLLAIEDLRGPVDTLSVALCGDLSMRAARSLLKLLSRFRPRSLRLIAPEGRDDPRVDLSSLSDRTERSPSLASANLGAIDVLYMVGLPPRSGTHELDYEDRRQYMLDARTVSGMPDNAVVLSPLPLLDEIDAEARADDRVKMFAQSDLGMGVRMAVLERCLAESV